MPPKKKRGNFAPVGGGSLTQCGTGTATPPEEWPGIPHDPNSSEQKAYEQLLDIFAGSIEPDTIYMVLTEHDFKVDAAVEALLKLNNSANSPRNKPASPKLSFNNIFEFAERNGKQKTVNYPDLDTCGGAGEVVNATATEDYAIGYTGGGVPSKSNYGGLDTFSPSHNKTHSLPRQEVGPLDNFTDTSLGHNHSMAQYNTGAAVNGDGGLDLDLDSEIMQEIQEIERQQREKFLAAHNIGTAGGSTDHNKSANSPAVEAPVKFEPLQRGGSSYHKKDQHYENSEPRTQQDYNNYNQGYGQALYELPPRLQRLTGQTHRQGYNPHYKNYDAASSRGPRDYRNHANFNNRGRYNAKPGGYQPYQQGGQAQKQYRQNDRHSFSDPPASRFPNRQGQPQALAKKTTVDKKPPPANDQTSYSYFAQQGKVQKQLVSKPQTDLYKSKQAKTGQLEKRFSWEVEPLPDGKVLCLLRGLPGSGKSTLARKLVGSGIILSTDEFFTRSAKYVFDFDKLGEAHEWNQMRAKNSMEERKTPVIVDNTNCQFWEMKPYVKLAKKYDYAVVIREPKTPWKFKVKELAQRNKHRVAADKIKKMLERYDKNVTAEFLLASVEATNSGQQSSGSEKPIDPEKITEAASDDQISETADKDDSDDVAKQQTAAAAAADDDDDAEKGTTNKEKESDDESGKDGSIEKDDSPEKDDSLEKDDSPTKEESDASMESNQQSTANDAGRKAAVKKKKKKKKKKQQQKQEVATEETDIPVAEEMEEEETKGGDDAGEMKEDDMKGEEETKQEGTEGAKKKKKKKKKKKPQKVEVPVEEMDSCAGFMSCLRPGMSFKDSDSHAKAVTPLRGGIYGNCVHHPKEENVSLRTEDFNVNPRVNFGGSSYRPMSWDLKPGVWSEQEREEQARRGSRDSEPVEWTENQEPRKKDGGGGGSRAQKAAPPVERPIRIIDVDSMSDILDAEAVREAILKHREKTESSGEESDDEESSNDFPKKTTRSQQKLSRPPGAGQDPKVLRKPPGKRDKKAGKRFSSQVNDTRSKSNTDKVNESESMRSVEESESKASLDARRAEDLEEHRRIIMLSAQHVFGNYNAKLLMGLLSEEQIENLELFPPEDRRKSKSKEGKTADVATAKPHDKPAAKENYEVSEEAVEEMRKRLEVAGVRQRAKERLLELSDSDDSGKTAKTDPPKKPFFGPEKPESVLRREEFKKKTNDGNYFFNHPRAHRRPMSFALCEEGDRFVPVFGRHNIVNVFMVGGKDDKQKKERSEESKRGLQETEIASKTPNGDGKAKTSKPKVKLAPTFDGSTDPDIDDPARGNPESALSTLNDPSELRTKDGVTQTCDEVFELLQSLKKKGPGRVRTPSHLKVLNTKGSRFVSKPTDPFRATPMPSLWLNKSTTTEDFPFGVNREDNIKFLYRNFTKVTYEGVREVLTQCDGDMDWAVDLMLEIEHCTFQEKVEVKDLLQREKLRLMKKYSKLERTIECTGDFPICYKGTNQVESKEGEKVTDGVERPKGKTELEGTEAQKGTDHSKNQERENLGQTPASDSLDSGRVDSQKEDALNENKIDACTVSEKRKSEDDDLENVKEDTLDENKKDACTGSEKRKSEDDDLENVKEDTLNSDDICESKAPIADVNKLPSMEQASSQNADAGEPEDNVEKAMENQDDNFEFSQDDEIRFDLPSEDIVSQMKTFLTEEGAEDPPGNVEECRDLESEGDVEVSDMKDAENTSDTKEEEEQDSEAPESPPVVRSAEDGDEIYFSTEEDVTDEMSSSDVPAAENEKTKVTEQCLTPDQETGHPCVDEHATKLGVQESAGEGCREPDLQVISGEACPKDATDKGSDHDSSEGVSGDGQALEITDAEDREDVEQTDGEKLSLEEELSVECDQKSGIGEMETPIENTEKTETEEDNAMDEEAVGVREELSTAEQEIVQVPTEESVSVDENSEIPVMAECDTEDKVTDPEAVEERGVDDHGEMEERLVDGEETLLTDDHAVSVEETEKAGAEPQEKMDERLVVDGEETSLTDDHAVPVEETEKLGTVPQEESNNTQDMPAEQDIAEMPDGDSGEGVNPEDRQESESLPAVAVQVAAAEATGEDAYDGFTAEQYKELERVAALSVADLEMPDYAAALDATFEEYLEELRSTGEEAQARLDRICADFPDDASAGKDYRVSYEGLDQFLTDGIDAATEGVDLFAEEGHGTPDRLAVDATETEVPREQGRETEQPVPEEPTASGNSETKHLSTEATGTAEVISVEVGRESESKITDYSDAPAGAALMPGDILQMPMDPLLALQLQEMFGPVTMHPSAGLFPHEDYNVNINYELAKQIYQCWVETLEKKGDSYRREMEQILKADEALARELQKEEDQKRKRKKSRKSVKVESSDSSSPSSSRSSSPRGKRYVPLKVKMPAQSPPKPFYPQQDAGSLKEIMDEQMALQISEDDRTAVKEEKREKEDFAKKLKREKLKEMFPKLDPEALDEIFEANNCELGATIQLIRASLGLIFGPDSTTLTSPATPTAGASANSGTATNVTNTTAAASKLPVAVPPEARHFLLGTKEDSTSHEEEEEDYEYQAISDPKYKDYRAEADMHYKLRHECFQKAAEAYKRGQRQLAVVYSQQGHVHTSKLRDANKRASEKILERRSASLDENTLDLHGLHVNEALDALEKILQKKEAEVRNLPSRRRFTHLTVVTGSGSHSRGGVARIRPTVISWLKRNDYQYVEQSAAVLKVLLK